MKTGAILGLFLMVLLNGTSLAEARQRLAFTPGHHGRSYAVARPRARWHWTRHAQRYAPTRHASHPAPAHPAQAHPNADTAEGRPGGGFTMQDGVLTYPAPARFQPKNFKRN
jgi:hypothetical protein